MSEPINIDITTKTGKLRFMINDYLNKTKTLNKKRDYLINQINEINQKLSCLSENDDKSTLELLESQLFEAKDDLSKLFAEYQHMTETILHISEE